MKAPIGCGVTEHPEHCLCDVKPVNVRISVSDGVHEMWMGKRICDIRGHSGGWTRNSILDYFQDLCRFYDEWSAHTSGVRSLPENFSDLSLPDEIRENREFNKWWLVRDFVNNAYNHYGYDMNTILRQVGVTPQDWFVSFIGGRVNTPHRMTEEKLAVIENEFTEFTLPNMVELAVRVNLSEHIIESMRDLFANRRRQLHGDMLPEKVKKSAAEMLKRLSLETDKQPKEILAAVEAETGITFSNSYVAQIRKRNNKRTPI